MPDIEVSVAVCTYNRDKYILDNFQHLYKQSAEKGLYEVLIINNNSTDYTERISKDFISQHTDLNIKYFNEENQGLSYARNRGINEAKGKIIAFIDDDAFAEKDYISNMIKFFADHPDVMAIGGHISPVYESVQPKWMSKYLLTLVAALDKGSQPVPFKGRKFPIGANMAFRAKTFQSHGMFNVNLGRKGKALEAGEEKDVFHRLRLAGEAVYYAPNVKVDHFIPDSRTTSEYIKKQALGIGKSERVRLKSHGLKAKVAKYFSELIKIGGTMVLAFFYTIKLEAPKAIMLIRFRWWVLNGLLAKN